jgi:hypothetical protein
VGFIEDSTWHQGHLSIVTLTVTNPSFGTFRGHALKRPWLESEVTCNAYAAGEPWEVAGAEGPLDIAEEVAGSITPLTTGEQGFALSPDVVRRWVDDPANNQGILLDDSGR